jgi:Effector-associated domain 4/NB-ARC domain
MQHRLNTSDNVKQRIIEIIHQLIQDANTPSNHALGKWRDGSVAAPELRIYCKTADFKKRFYPDPRKASNDFNNDLKVLKDRLGILTDHRSEPNGSRHLDLTLKLWSKQSPRNIEEFHKHWQKCQQETKPALRHNLPNGSYASFVGYSEQRQQLTNLLSSNRSKGSPPLITIDGIAGSGKTSLLLEVVHRQMISAKCPFEAIVFTSAQPNRCTPQGMMQRVQIDRHLTDILHQILLTLQTLDIVPTDLAELISSTKQALAQQRTLLIIDNIETTADHEALFTFLQELPTTVTTILTSRLKLGFGTIISLGGLDLADGKALIQQIAAQKQIALTAAHIKKLSQVTGGLPLAIEYLITAAYLLGGIENLPLQPHSSTQENLNKYCFEDLMSQLRGKFAHRILLALSLFTHPASRAAALFIADLQQYPLRPSADLEELKFLNLVLEAAPNTYDMHSLTREYSRQELSQDREYEGQYLDRWVNYYLEYTTPFGQLNWRDWQDYGALDREWLNIRDVVEHCVTNQRLDLFTQFWHNLQGYTLLQGKWLERLSWLDWWVANSSEQPIQLANALYYQSQTLAHQNEADPTGRSIQLAHQAWKYSSQASAQLRFDIALHLAAIHIRQSQVSADDLELANQWLQQAEQSLDPSHSSAEVQWHQSQICYYQAEICHGSGDYAKAKQLYLQTQRLAADLGFHRLATYANSRAAINAMQLKGAKELEDAYQRFQQVLQASIAHQDHRAIAMTQLNLAQVERDRKQKGTAKSFAHQAFQSFKRLSMDREAAAAAAILQTITGS